MTPTLIIAGKLVALFATHAVADFFLQSRSMAENKSKDSYVLFQHMGVHYLAFLLMGWTLGLEAKWYMNLALYNALIHGSIDWFLWRGFKRTVEYRYGHLADTYYEYQKDYLFWWFLGTDQFLNISTIVAIYFAAIQ